MPETLSKTIRKKRFTAMLDKFAGGTIALFFAYIVAASTDNTPESIGALFASTTSIFVLLFYKLMLSYDSAEKPEKESVYLLIMYQTALVIPLITFMLILHSINAGLSVFAFFIFLICLAFFIAFLLHGYKREKNVSERVSTPNESNKKTAKRADKKFFPYIIFAIGLLYGLGFAIDWNIQVGGLWDVSFKTQLETEKSAWDIVAAIGSLLAGLGTVGLLAFGWIKANDWIKAAKHAQKLEFETSLAFEISKHAIDLLAYFSGYLIPKVVDGNLENDDFFYFKLFNEYSIRIEHSVVTANTLISMNNQHNGITDLLSLKIEIETAAKNLAESYLRAETTKSEYEKLDYYLNDELYKMNLKLVNLLKKTSDEYFQSLYSRD